MEKDEEILMEQCVCVCVGGVARVIYCYINFNIDRT